MSSNVPPALATSKSSNVSSPTGSASSQSQQFQFGGDRRAVSTPASSSSRHTTPTPRNSQSFKKPHKNQRRPRLADEDAMAEHAAIRSSSSRKGQTSITHLMNFALPPRPQYSHSAHHVNRNYRRNPTWGLGSGYHAADKARYVNANYRFLVDPRGDYAAQAIDPDMHVDWGSVVQILASSTSQSSSCPICLSPPVAPRMAKCGHIFCLPCLIRYMHSTDDSEPVPEKKARWKKCPICYDSIYTSETRPVRFFEGKEIEMPQPGDDIMLRLTLREPGSILALPRDGADNLIDPSQIPWHSDAEVMDSCRIMKATEDYMVSQFDHEISLLEIQGHDDEIMYGDDSGWTRRAVKLVAEAKEKVKDMGNPPPSEREKSKLLTQPLSSGSLRGDANGQPGAQSDSSETPTQQPERTRSMKMPLRTKGPDGQSHADMAYYFYQALPHFYLSPLDIRILRAAFGDYSSFPSTLLPRVEHVSTGHSVDDDLRKRAKYLGHLPAGCEVCFLECDWTDIVSPEVLQRFETEIERRRKRNREKSAREEKERIRAEKEEDDKRWAPHRRKRPSISQTREASSSIDMPPLLSDDPTLPASVSPPHSSLFRNQTGSAYASLASPSTSPVAGRTVWGTAAVARSSPVLSAEAHHDHDISDQDGWLQGWERDFLEEDMRATASTSEGTSGTGTPSGKKKKPKKITLMSTNTRRGA